MYLNISCTLTLFLKNMRWWMLVDELWRQLSCARNRRVHRVRRVGKQSMVMVHVMWHVGRRRRRMHGRMEFSRVWQHHHFTNSIFFHHLSSNVRNEISVQKQPCKSCAFNQASPCPGLHLPSDSRGHTSRNEPPWFFHIPSMYHWKKLKLKAVSFKKMSLTHQSAKQDLNNVHIPLNK